MPFDTALWFGTEVFYTGRTAALVEVSINENRQGWLAQVRVRSTTYLSAVELSR